MVDAENEKDWLSFEKGTAYPSKILVNQLRKELLNIVPPSPFRFVVQGSLAIIFIVIIACMTYQWFRRRKQTMNAL